MPDNAHPAAPEIAALPRRRFLKTGLFVAAGTLAVLGGGIALLSRSPTDGLPRPAGIVALDDAEYQLFLAVCAAALPAGGELVDWRTLPVMASIDAMVATIPAHARGEVTAAFRLFDYGALLSHGRRFTDLETAAALEYLRAWNAGNQLQRASSNLVRKLAYLAYWQQPATWPRVDYDGPVTRKWGLPSLGNAPLPANEPAGTQPGVAA